MGDKAKIERCKYSHPHFKNNSIEYHCVVDGWEDDKVRICKKGEYIEIFVNPKNPTELYEPADNFSSEDYINSEWVTIKNLTIRGTLLMLTGWTLICFIL